jgi:putative Mn2+ efflux pump MntP
MQKKYLFISGAAILLCLFGPVIILFFDAEPGAFSVVTKWIGYILLFVLGVAVLAGAVYIGANVMKANGERKRLRKSERNVLQSLLDRR